MIGADPSAVWFPLSIIVAIAIASITLGSLNLNYKWGQLILWCGIVELVLAIIISIFVYGNKGSKRVI